MAKLDCHVFGVPPSDAGHSHPYAHILLPLQSELEVLLDGHSYRLTPHHLGFIAPGRYHHCICSTEIIMMNIPESMILPADLEILSTSACLPLTGELEPLIELIKKEVRFHPGSDSVRYLYYYLYAKLVETGGCKSLRHIREHFSEEISISALAKLENYNLTYFTDWFKKQTGFSPSAYIRRVRIEKAKELITTSHFRLLDIALQVGYTGNASFTRAFKEMEGVSPAEYRRRYHLENPAE